MKLGKHISDVVFWKLRVPLGFLPLVGRMGFLHRKGNAAQPCSWLVPSVWRCVVSDQFKTSLNLIVKCPTSSMVLKGIRNHYILFMFHSTPTFMELKVYLSLSLPHNSEYSDKSDSNAV